MSNLRRRASWTEEDERAEVQEIIRLREMQKQKAEERKKVEKYLKPFKAKMDSLSSGKRGSRRDDLKSLFGLWRKEEKKFSRLSPEIWQGAYDYYVKTRSEILDQQVSWAKKRVRVLGEPTTAPYLLERPIMIAGSEVAQTLELMNRKIKKDDKDSDYVNKIKKDLEAALQKLDDYLESLSIMEKNEIERTMRNEARNRARIVKDITKRVSIAEKDKELESLAEEVGTLQAQPKYVREHGRKLSHLQEIIEKKYSVVGKGIRYLKKLFSRGKRASQIRVASQMNRELQREIKALKRDLTK